MIKKILLKIVLTLFLISLSGQEAFAPVDPEVTGTPDVYKVTLTKYEVLPEGGTWAIVWEGSKSFDIAKATAGEIVGNLFSGLRLNPGRYKGRATVSRTFTLKGRVDKGCSQYAHTQSGHTPRVDGKNFDDGTNEDEETITIPVSMAANSYFVVTDSGSWTVGSGESLEATVSFDVANTLVWYPEDYFDSGVPGANGIFYPSAPQVTVSTWE